MQESNAGPQCTFHIIEDSITISIETATLPFNLTNLFIKRLDTVYAVQWVMYFYSHCVRPPCEVFHFLSRGDYSNKNRKWHLYNRLRHGTTCMEPVCRGPSPPLSHSLTKQSLHSLPYQPRPSASWLIKNAALCQIN